MKTECEDDDIMLKKMPENVTLNIPSSAVEELRCSTCKKYLSNGPIYVLPNGRSICGHCSPDNSNVGRAVDFEGFLRYITFPCSFQQFGCTQQVPFGQTLDHESVCTYRIPLCPWKDCMWQGPVSNVRNHLIGEHAHLFKNKAVFKIQVDENAQEAFLVKKDNVIFVIKYFYDNKDGILSYDIRYCNNTNVKNAHFKLGLINDTDAECNMNLKRISCASYDLNFHIKNEHNLNLTKFLESLSNPNCIAVTVELFVEYNINVNDELLKTLKCQVCTRYLIPPLYKLDNGTVCSDCAATRTNCQPLIDDKLLHLVTEVELPCRWEECEFSGKCKTLRKHESECQFKFYDCWLCHVKKLKITEAIDHYKEKHNAHQYMLEKISLKINVINTDFAQYVIANKNNMLILFRLIKNSSLDLLNLFFNSLPTDINYGTVNIEHQHCTFKPIPFQIYRHRWLKIGLNTLPSCFKKNDPNLTFIVDFH